MDNLLTILIEIIIATIITIKMVVINTMRQKTRQRLRSVMAIEAIEALIKGSLGNLKKLLHKKKLQLLIEGLTIQN